MTTMKSLTLSHCWLQLLGQPLEADRLDDKSCVLFFPTKQTGLFLKMMLQPIFPFSVFMLYNFVTGLSLCIKPYSSLLSPTISSSSFISSSHLSLASLFSPSSSKSSYLSISSSSFSFTIHLLLHPCSFLPDSWQSGGLACVVSPFVLSCGLISKDEKRAESECEIEDE